MSSAIPEGATGPGPEDHSEYIPDTSVSNAPEPQVQQYSEPSSTAPLNSQPVVDSNGNPAWAPFREKLPESLFNEVRPELEKWDKNYQQVQQQFAPYKDLAAQGVAPDTVKRAVQFAQLLNSDPRAIWESLGQRYNFGAELASQGQQESEQDPDIDEEDTYDPDAPFDPANIDLSQNPQFQQWAQQAQAQQEYLQNMENQRMEQETQQQIAAEWNEVQRLNGGAPLSTQEQTEVIRRANWIADMKDQQTNRPGFHVPSLKEGWADYQQFVATARATRANNTAPAVFGGNGGVPAAPKGITADMSDEERVNYIAERARQLNESQ